MKGLVAAAVIVGAVSATAQPAVHDARITPVAMTQPLADTIATLVRGAAEPIWIAYETRVEDGDAAMCCWSGDGSSWGRGDGFCCGGCRLEPGSGSTAMRVPDTGARRLEPRETFLVFYRVEGRKIERIRTFADAFRIKKDDEEGENE